MEPNNILVQNNSIQTNNPSPAKVITTKKSKDKFIVSNLKYLTKIDSLYEHQKNNPTFVSIIEDQRKDQESKHLSEHVLIRSMKSTELRKWFEDQLRLAFRRFKRLLASGGNKIREFKSIIASLIDDMSSVKSPELKKILTNMMNHCSHTKSDCQFFAFHLIQFLRRLQDIAQHFHSKFKFSIVLDPEIIPDAYIIDAQMLNKVVTTHDNEINRQALQMLDNLSEKLMKREESCNFCGQEF